MIHKLLYILTAFLIATATAHASTTITAQVVRNQAGAGETFISSGFPFPPGLVTESTITSGTIRVVVNGTEVAANVSALRGRHTDGTVRSALIQFTVPNMTVGDAITTNTRVVVDGGVRVYSDPAYVRPTWDMVQNNNVILPSDPEYLSSTKITFQNLLPAGQGTASEEKQYTTLADTQFDSLVANPQGGAATYENVRAMLTLWARTGNKKYFNHAIDYTDEWIRYNTPTNGSSCVNLPYVNMDGRTNGANSSCGMVSEQHAPRHFSYASLYLLTGYRDFWSIVANQVQSQQSPYYITDQSTANANIILSGSYDGLRYHYSSRYGAMIAAHAIDATTRVPVPGGLPTSEINWQNNFSWVLNAIKNHEWNFYWIPYDTGSGTVPVYGSSITQGAVSATLAGVYAQRFDPRRADGKAMPTSGYLMVKNITGGSFSLGALSGISATATGSQESDYRQGLTGVRADSQRAPNGSTLTGAISDTTLTVTTGTGVAIGSNLQATGIPGGTFIVSQDSGTAGGPGTYTISESCNVSSTTITYGTSLPVFQLTFINNFLIDYYLNVYADSRIPDMVKKNTDVILVQVKALDSGDGSYGKGDATWGYPSYGNPYNMQNPVVTTGAMSYELPEFARSVAFVLKTLGSDTVNGASYETWYNRLIDTANIVPVIGLAWQWKNFGQFYGFGADAPWMMAQSSLTSPSSIRTPTYYGAIPGDTPDVYRTAPPLGTGRAQSGTARLSTGTGAFQ